MLKPFNRRGWLTLFYGLSGTVALCYEVLWAKMLNLAFGISSFGVTVTVAAFMLGLGLGSILGRRWLSSIRHPLRFFACLEGGVALFALSFSSILQWSMALTEPWMMGLPVEAWFALQGLFLILVLLLPTLAMGMGFPVILRAFQNSSGTDAANVLAHAENKYVVGRLYGVNTLGGAMGALLPLALLPWLGVHAALVITAMLGLLVAGMALYLSGLIPTGVATPLPKPRWRVTAYKPLLCYAGMGAAALILEVAWVRLYGLVFLRTEYVLAIILAVYLAGIALGSLCARRFPAQALLNAFPIGVVIFVVSGLWVFPSLAQWVHSQEFNSLAVAMLWQGGAVTLMTLPVTLILGAWLPLLVNKVTADDSQTPAALWYGANSIGASLGICLAGFVLFSWIGTYGSVLFAGFTLAVLGSYWASPSARRGLLLFTLPVLLLWIGSAALYRMPPAQRLVTSLPSGTKDVLRYEDAVSITHVVEQPDGQRLLLTDLQRMDASSAPAAVQTQMNQARLPLFLQSEARSILFLGLGTGITAAGSLLTSPRSPPLKRTAVELSRGAIMAAERWFLPVNQHIVEKSAIIHDDVRRFVRRTDAQYDIIIGDVFHPDQVGRSALLSVEQFMRVKRRLSRNGVFVQWLALNQFDVPALKIILRTFKHAYPESRLFVDGFRLALVGYRHKTSIRLSNINERDQLWLGRYWGQINNKVLGKGVLESEWAPVIEYPLARLHYQKGNALAVTLEWLLNNRPLLDVAMAQLNEEDKRRMEAPYAATQLLYRGWLDEMRGQISQAQRMFRFAYQANPQDPWVRSAMADRLFASLKTATQRGMNKQQALLRIISIDPLHVESLRALWHLEEAQGHSMMAKKYRLKVRELSPLDRDVQ